MDTKKIESLLVAIDKGSLTSAAEELGYTQSGMTHMMNSLEDELGLTLLIRSKTGVRLSPAGYELLPKMRALLTASRDLEKEAGRLKEKGLSTLRLGAYSSIARHWVPEILADLRIVSPDTQVSLSMNDIESLYSGVRSDALDCALVSYQEHLSQGLCWIPLWDDELLAILPDSPEYGGTGFPVEQFEGMDFLMPTQGFELDILPALTAEGRKSLPHIHSSTLDDASIVSMVEHNLGVSILSELIMSDIHYRVRTMPLIPAAWRSLGIIAAKDRISDKNIRRLISCATEVVGRRYHREDT